VSTPLTPGPALGDNLAMAATAASERLLKETAAGIGALTAAIELDIDRSDEDRTFFTAERAALQLSFDNLFNADAVLTKHQLLVQLPLQVRTVVGDNVLDRGVRAGKAGMRLALKNTSMPGGEDHVFPADITEITDAERRVEPNLVLKVAAKFDQVPDYDGKAKVKADLEGRANRQNQAFTDRDAGELKQTALEGALARAISEADDALLRFEKRMEERFLRDARYVTGFFLEKPTKKKKKPAESAPKTDGATQPTQGTGAPEGAGG
jgi:hypothetical protein